MILRFTSFIAVLTVSAALAADTKCLLGHSSSSTLKSSGRMGVRVSDEDSVVVKISGLGQVKAMLNGQYALTLLKEIDGVFYYQQADEKGLIVWAYCPTTKHLSYSKLQPTLVDRLPDAYFLVVQCK